MWVEHFRESLFSLLMSLVVTKELIGVNNYIDLYIHASIIVLFLICLVLVVFGSFGSFLKGVCWCVKEWGKFC